MNIQLKDKNDNLLKQYLGMCKKAFACNFIFSFFINILTLSTSIYSLQILDRVLSSGSMETLLMLSMIMLVIYIILAFLQIIRSFVFNQISNWLDIKLSSPLLESAIAFDARTKGSQNLRDLRTLKSFINSEANVSLFDAPWAILYFIVIFFIHWINGLIVVVGAIILFILALIDEKLTSKYAKRSNEIGILSMKRVDSISRNAEVIKAMGMKFDMTKAWQKINNEVNKINNLVSSKSTIIKNISKSIRLLIQMAVMAVGAMLVIQGKMSAGGIIATSILAGRALSPFDNAIYIYKAFLGTKQSYSRLSRNLKQYEVREEKLTLPEPEGKIQLDKISYIIPNSDQMVIKGINITINAGEIIGMIGPSGSGKTTLARLMADILTPDKGSVRLDGGDLKNQNSEEIGKYIGYLPQTIELFEGNIKDNIARMKEKIKSEEIVEAAKFANIHDLIIKLPKAYETNAMNLSAGQKQRVGLARAFFRKPKFVILDEPNSNLDNEGENALMNTIKNAKKAKITTIIISHRPLILNIVDKVLELHGGKVKMFDNVKNRNEDN